MRYSKKISIFLCLLSLFRCAKKQTPPTQKPLVLVSIAPYRFLTEKIAGDILDVKAVVPAASNPHSFEPTSLDVSRMSQAEVWFRIGEPFEKKIVSVLQAKNPSLAVADLREGVELIEEFHELSCKHCSMDHLDRHIWLSPKQAQKQAKLIERTLSEKYPDQKEIFKENCKLLCQDLEDLDLEIREILKAVEHRTLLVSHPAFGYFCKDFGLTQLSIEYEGKDPRPKHLEEILKRAVEESAEIALALPQYNNKGAQLIAEKIHKPVRYIDPYSADYFETMRKLAKLIADPYAN
jgi:zinc transport system substrate-binding protein